MMRIISVIIFSILNFLTFVMIIVLIYGSYPTAIGISISIVIAIIGIWWTYKAFVLSYKIGVLDMFIATHASPDLDVTQRMDKEKGSEVSLETLSDIILGYEVDKIIIWGDYKSKGLSDSCQILAVTYNSKEDRLFIEFDNQNSMYVFGAEGVFMNEAYVRIYTSKNLIWKWDKGTKYVAYTYQNNRLTTDSNSWRDDYVVIDPNQPAVSIYR